MSANQEFDKRVAEAHRLGQISPVGGVAAAEKDLEREELHALVDSYLGEDYDREKVRKLEAAQSELAAKHAQIAASYQEGHMGPTEYVEQFNAVAFESFGKMETILGRDDYLRLFGPTPDRAMGFLDKGAFIRDHEQRSGQPRDVPNQATVGERFSLATYANVVRVNATPEEVILDFGLDVNPLAKRGRRTAVERRVVMSLYTAKRFVAALTATVRRHEQAFGTVEVDLKHRLSAAQAPAT